VGDFGWPPGGWFELVRGLLSCGMLYFEGLDHAAHHTPGSEQRPASAENMITPDRDI
jgi:hypothetical protein